MSKQNKVLYRVLGVLVIAVLICLCFLGSTFARYTSSASGSGGVAVAYWQVGGNNALVYLSSNTITPSLDEYSGDSSYTTTDSTDASGSTYTVYSVNGARTNTSGYVQALKVVNSGDVAAVLEPDSLVKGDINFVSTSYYNSEGSAVARNDSDVSSSSESETSFSGTITAALVRSMLSYNLYIYDSTSGYVLLSQASEQQLFMQSNGGSLIIYAQVTWTSDVYYNSSVYCGVSADEIDTWIGENVDHITFEITMNAVQASQHTNGSIEYMSGVSVSGNN